MQSGQGSVAEQAAAYLKAAASGRRLPPAQVLSAILALEKAKLPVRFTRLQGGSAFLPVVVKLYSRRNLPQNMYVQADEFLDTLCGHGREGGKRWRLVFNAGAHSFSLAWPHRCHRWPYRKPSPAQCVKSPFMSR